MTSQALRMPAYVLVYKLTKGVPTWKQWSLINQWPRYFKSWNYFNYLKETKIMTQWCEKVMTWWSQINNNVTQKSQDTKVEHSKVTQVKVLKSSISMKCWSLQTLKSEETKFMINLRSTSKQKEKVKIVKLETWLSERSQPYDVEVNTQKHGKTKT